MSKEVLIRLEDVKKYFEFKDGFATQYVKAVDGITLDIFKDDFSGPDNNMSSQILSLNYQPVRLLMNQKLGFFMPRQHHKTLRISETIFRRCGDVDYIVIQDFQPY